MNTETEARKKWCPFVRAMAELQNGPRGGVTVNRLHTGSIAKSLCIASDCMMWRSAYVTHSQEVKNEPWGDQPASGSFEVTRTEHLGGYCGLAEQPVSYGVKGTGF